MASNVGFARATSIASQDRQHEVMLKILDMWPKGIEQKNVGAPSISKKLGVHPAFVGKLAKDMETLGILKRRYEYPGNGGKQVHWTILVDKLTASNLLTEFHKNLRSGIQPEKVFGHPSSIRVRMENFLRTANSPLTCKEIEQAIVRPDEKIGLHRITHVLYDLMREAKVTFKNDTTGDKVPYDIRPTAKLLKMNGLTQEAIETKIEAARKPEVLPEPAPDLDSYKEPEIKETSGRVAQNKWPDIDKLANKKTSLMIASRAAADAGEEDLAIMLEERANKPMTSFEQQVIALYEAYKECNS